jgi:hypothetical protein
MLPRRGSASQRVGDMSLTFAITRNELGEGGYVLGVRLARVPGNSGAGTRLKYVGSLPAAFSDAGSTLAASIVLSNNFVFSYLQEVAAGSRRYLCRISRQRRSSRLCSTSAFVT